MPSLTWLGVPGDKQAWASLGFAVHDNAVQMGHVCCSFTAAPAWGFNEIHCQEKILGVETIVRPALEGWQHACGVTRVDHVVYAVRDLDSAINALNAVLGIEPRRRFHPRGPQGPEMAFYRVGEAFIEVVATGSAPALIGLALWSPDLDYTVAQIRSHGGPVSDPTDAVQGGRIATIWRGHLNWGLAVMGP